MNYLLIDTSNQPLSVAIMKDNEVIAEKTTDIKRIIQCNSCPK